MFNASNLLALFVFKLLLTLGCAQREYFNYTEPENWSEEWKNCGGRRQSPIELDENRSLRRNCPSLNFVRFGDKQFHVGGYLIRGVNGSTLEVTLEPTFNHTTNLDDSSYITGGRLEGRYRVEKMEFHWNGTEHTINETGFSQRGKGTYMMEIHTFLVNERHYDLEDALPFYNGVVALASFAQDGFYNKLLKPLTDCCEELLKNKKDKCKISKLSLYDFIPEKNRNSYYTYIGSLTTPPCTEGVMWIVFTTPIRMSETQASHFANLGPRNIRPIQPANGRVIHYNSKSCVYRHQ